MPYINLHFTYFLTYQYYNTIRYRNL